MNPLEERDALEDLVRAWDIYEHATNDLAVIDYDLDPHPSPITVESRKDVMTRMRHLQASAFNPYVKERITAHLAYLDELCKEGGKNESSLPSFKEYLTLTQGGPVRVPTEKQFISLKRETQQALNDIGVPWGRDLIPALTIAEGDLPDGGLISAILGWKDYFEPDIRKITGSTADFTLTTEFVNVDDYWGYWVGGEGDSIRLRINERQARHFSSVHAASMAAHELPGHGLQLTTWRQNALLHPDAYLHPRYSTLHTGEQILLEGIAQTWPLFLPSTGRVLRAYTLLTCYVAVAWMDAHLLLNSPQPNLNDIADTVELRLPWWTRERIMERMTYQTANPSHKSYLWAYGVGALYFLNLRGKPDVLNVLNQIYQRPYSYEELLAFCPEQ